jgi:transposase InsO family protein
VSGSAADATMPNGARTTRTQQHRDLSARPSLRATQYTSAEFADGLAAHRMRPSAGRTGVCWDNAMAESFVGALKNEWLSRTTFATRTQDRQAVCALHRRLL